MSVTAAQTLAERLAAGKPPLEETLQYALSLALALKVSHDRGQPVGTLHPTSIAIDGAVVRWLDTTTADPTPYLSPERLQGAAPDVRSDIFAFGAILREMLGGGHATPLPEIRPDLARLLQRCLAPSPPERWQRAAALVIEIKLVLATLRHSQQADQLHQHLSTLRSHLGDLQQTVLTHSVALENVAISVSQTDEVVEHVVDAFDAMQSSLIPSPTPNPGAIG